MPGAGSVSGRERNHSARVERPVLASLVAEDRPYRIETDRGAIAELPVHWSLDDWEQHAFLPAPQIGSVIESPRKALELR
jgi:hypothetical protein